jgi:hypothetical protein
MRLKCLVPDTKPGCDDCCHRESHEANFGCRDAKTGCGTCGPSTARCFATKPRDRQILNWLQRQVVLLKEPLSDASVLQLELVVPDDYLVHDKDGNPDLRLATWAAMQEERP